MEMNDYAKSWGGLSPYEQVKIGYMQSKRPSGVGIAGLATGVAGILTGVAAMLWAGSKSNGVKAYAEAKHDGLRDIVMMNAQSLAAERAERIAGDVTLTNTVTDSVSGSQQGTLTALQQAELAASQATQQVMTQTYSDFVTGRASLNPTPVSLYSSPKPCDCPSSCGCNG